MCWRNSCHVCTFATSLGTTQAPAQKGGLLATEGRAAFWLLAALLSGVSMYYLAMMTAYAFTGYAWYAVLTGVAGFFHALLAGSAACLASGHELRRGLAIANFVFTGLWSAGTGFGTIALAQLADDGETRLLLRWGGTATTALGLCWLIILFATAGFILVRVGAAARQPEDKQELVMYPDGAASA